MIVSPCHVIPLAKGLVEGTEDGVRDKLSELVYTEPYVECLPKLYVFRSLNFKFPILEWLAHCAMARRKEFKAAEWTGIRLGLVGFLGQVAYELISANHERFKPLAWPCMKPMWYHWRHKPSHLPFFPSVWPFLCSIFNLSPSPLD